MHNSSLYFSLNSVINMKSEMWRLFGCTFSNRLIQIECCSLLIFFETSSIFIFLFIVFSIFQVWVFEFCIWIWIEFLNKYWLHFFLKFSDLSFSNHVPFFFIHNLCILLNKIWFIYYTSLAFHFSTVDLPSHFSTQHQRETNIETKWHLALHQFEQKV